jgi:hypothetical protein
VAALWGSVPIRFGKVAGWAGFGLWAETTPPAFFPFSQFFLLFFFQILNSDLFQTFANLFKSTQTNS